MFRSPSSKRMSRLFGTDGFRGKAGEHPLDHETVARLGAALNAIPGVVEHGLFIGLASKVILAEAAGVRVIERPVGR